MLVVTHVLPIESRYHEPLSGLVTSFSPSAQNFTSRLLHALQSCPRHVPGESIHRLRYRSYDLGTNVGLRGPML